MRVHHPLYLRPERIRPELGIEHFPPVESEQPIRASRIASSEEAIDDIVARRSGEESAHLLGRTLDRVIHHG